jgi:hypothetical protein
MNTENKTRDYLTIVAGLPRSGTSVTMQMIAAGGIEPLTDNVRKADVDNPKGYLEFEPVKKTREDSSWVPTGVGRVVKMVYRLLYDLPPDFTYRVVFTRRKIEESLASQRKMLQRLGKPAPPPDEKMLALFRKQLADCDAWLARQPNFSAVNVDYNQLVIEPRPFAEWISDFLDGLDVEAMVAVVDPALYRNRK